MFPLLANKMASYSKIGFMYLGFYLLGHSYVVGQFGDKSQFNYLFTNKGAIMNGTKGWDKEWSLLSTIRQNEIERTKINRK